MKVAVRHDESIMVREVDGEIVVLDVAANRLHRLNATASLVWRMCAEGTTADSIVSQLVACFDVDEGTARQDVGTVLAELRRLDLLTDR